GAAADLGGGVREQPETTKIEHRSAQKRAAAEQADTKEPSAIHVFFTGEPTGLPIGVIVQVDCHGGPESARIDWHLPCSISRHAFPARSNPAGGPDRGLLHAAA